MKKTLKRYTPDHKKIKEHKHLQWLGDHIHSPSLWYFNRKSISKAFAVGLFCAFIPVPFQMVLAAIGAVIFSSNLALSIALVWITNPITMPPIFYGTYKLGALILGTEVKEFIFSFDYLLSAFAQIWQPFLLGCFISAAVSSFVGYWAIQLAYRWIFYKRKKLKNKSKR